MDRSEIKPFIAKRVAKELGGWCYYLLTEDIEFTVDHVIKGYKVGFAKNYIKSKSFYKVLHRL